MVDLVGSTTYQYDAANRLTSVTQYGKTIQYGDHVADRETQRTGCHGGHTFAYDGQVGCPGRSGHRQKA